MYSKIESYTGITKSGKPIVTMTINVSEGEGTCEITIAQPEEKGCSEFDNAITFINIAKDLYLQKKVEYDKWLKEHLTEV